MHKTLQNFSKNVSENLNNYVYLCDLVENYANSCIESLQNLSGKFF